LYVSNCVLIELLKLDMVVYMLYLTTIYVSDTYHLDIASRYSINVTYMFINVTMGEHSLKLMKKCLRQSQVIPKKDL
jgi:hypothetical protein